MNSMSFRCMFLLICLALPGGCADFSAITPGTPSRQVLSRAGKPDAVLKNPDGSQVWQYPLGPAGYQTYMITLGPDDAVRDVRQVLSDRYFDEVRPGMSREDVQRILGRPKEILYFPARDEETWTWRYMDGQPMFFNVIFDRTSGTVRSSLRIQEVFSGTDAS
jgi:hypothetical protein